MTTDRDIPPAPLRWAVWLLTAEAAALGVVAAFLVYEDIVGRAHDLVSALFVTGFAVGGVVVLALLARALGQRRPGARAPAIVLQLMLLPIGYYMILGGLAWLGAPLMVLGLVVCGMLVNRRTTAALGLD
ncbi:hypothetical protein [Micromonospora pattaloongensis]|uniref:hypothetical protein n=1 Tax=Micromonospora pattaloongensis TaxID=405436 RepID=UPI000B0AC6D4